MVQEEEKVVVQDIIEDLLGRYFVGFLRRTKSAFPPLYFSHGSCLPPKFFLAH
jgi:hypothetical protein